MHQGRSQTFEIEAFKRSLTHPKVEGSMVACTSEKPKTEETLFLKTKEVEKYTQKF